MELALKKRRFILVTKQDENTTVVGNSDVSDVSCSIIRFIFRFKAPEVTVTSEVCAFFSVAGK